MALPSTPRFGGQQPDAKSKDANHALWCNFRANSSDTNNTLLSLSSLSNSTASTKLKWQIVPFPTNEVGGSQDDFDKTQAPLQMKMIRSGMRTLNP
jgi:hypothetical protein